MKRILITGLFAMLCVGQLAAREKMYFGTYLTPNSLISFQEKKESNGGQLEQPGLTWVGKTTVLSKGQNFDRRGVKRQFNIHGKMQGNGWEIKQTTDAKGMPKFTLCLDKNRFLPGGLENKGWGPAHTGDITYQNDMVCFDLTYEAKPIDTIQK